MNQCRNPQALPPRSIQPSARLFELTVQKLIPFSMTVEITYRCPLRCVHCYLPETQGAAPVRREDELTTDQWKRVFDDLAAVGCLYLVVTGGEILVRPDALELCAHARGLGFETKLYTTGVTLREDQADEIAAMGLASVELSVYGRPETHDAITLLPGSFEKTMLAIDRLKARDVPVTIKCPLMKPNFQDRGFLVALAEAKGLRYKFDPTTAPRNDSGREPLELRMTAAQTMEILDDSQMISVERIETVKEDYHQDSFICSAGKNLGGINPFGDVFPCLQLPVPCGNLKEKSFREIWYGAPELKHMRAIKFSDLHACSTCEIRSYCSRCPGITLLEEGDILGPSRISCTLAKAQYERVHGPTDYIPAGLRGKAGEPENAPSGGCGGGGCGSCSSKSGGDVSFAPFETRHQKEGLAKPLVFDL